MATTTSHCGVKNCPQCLPTDYYRLYQDLYFGLPVKSGTMTSTAESYELLPPKSKQSNPTIMYQLTNIAKRLLSKDIKTLVKAGFMDSELEMTEMGRRELTGILFDKYQKELVEAATAKLEEAKENK